MSISTLDIRMLRDLPVEEVAERLGMRVVRHKALCPFHADTHPSLSFHRGRNTFRCFVCGASGSGPIDLVMKHQGLSFPDACHWLAKEWNKPLSSSPLKGEGGGAPAARKAHGVCRQWELRSGPQIDLPYLEHLVAEPVLTEEAQRFLYAERHISPEVVSRLGLTSIEKPVPMSRNLHDGWFHAPALLIPYRDAEGRLTGLQARYLGGEKQRPRFQFPRGFTAGIYNLPQLRQLHPAGDHLFITEGASDCWAMLSAGHKAIAIPSATLLQDQALSTALAAIPCLQTLQLHCCPDRDAPGERLYLDLKERFPHLVRHQLPEGYKDFAQWWKEHPSF